MELAFLISLSTQVGDKHACCAVFLLFNTSIRPSVFKEFKPNQVNPPLVCIQFLVLRKLLEI